MGARPHAWADIIDAALKSRHIPDTIVYRRDLISVRDMTEEQIAEVERRTGSQRSAHELFVAAAHGMRAHGMV